MLRRSFLGAVLSSVPLLRAQADNSIEKYLAPLNTEGMGLILVGDNYIRDPFIKVYTSQDKIVKYKKHAFKQRENYVLHYIKDSTKTYWNCYIPLDTKVNQKTKEDMLKEMNKYKNINYECFELIADNGKSNLYAVCDNDKFRANLKGNGKSQCSMQKF